MIPCVVYLAVPFFLPALRVLWHANMRNAPACTLEVFTHENVSAYMRENASMSEYDAFDALIPWAYKIDLWRTVIIWRQGGIYLDADTRLLKPIDRILDLSLDMVQIPKDRGPKCLWNGLFASNKGNVHTKAITARIVHNIHSRSLGYEDGPKEPWLGITGPCTFGKALRSHYRAVGQMHNDGVHIGDYARVESSVKTNFSPYYAELWGQRKIYKEQ